MQATFAVFVHLADACAAMICYERFGVVRCTEHRSVHFFMNFGIFTIERTRCVPIVRVVCTARPHDAQAGSARSHKKKQGQP
jgi:hypothetical protein